jgi:hypothetical protein
MATRPRRHPARIGTLDAGAVAVTVIFEALADRWPDASR